MRLKLFRAPAMAEAMARVRAELGEDALILATRRVGDGVEVTAALEPDDQPPPLPSTAPADPPASPRSISMASPPRCTPRCSTATSRPRWPTRSRSAPCRWAEHAAAAGRSAGRRQDADRCPSGHPAGDGRRRSRW